MNKIDLILKLVRDNKITDEEAKVLMVTEKEYVYHYYPYYQTTPYIVTYGAQYTIPGTTSGDSTTFASN